MVHEKKVSTVCDELGSDWVVCGVDDPWHIWALTPVFKRHLCVCFKEFEETFNCWLQRLSGSSNFFSISYLTHAWGWGEDMCVNKMLENVSSCLPKVAVWRSSSSFSCSEAISWNGKCFHSALAFCSDLTSMKIKIILDVLLGTPILNFCSTFKMKGM